MIRRNAGDEFLLITQMDHAALAQQLGTHFGNSKFVKPKATSTLLQAVGLHDAGWPLHDDAPTLNDRQLPLDVFETPREIVLAVWTASSDRAEAVDPYAGLLVSLHSLALSIYATPPEVSKQATFDVRKMQDQFAVNKFQHREVERQETLRQKLGFSTRVPLRHGLAEARASKADDQLRFDFKLLQAMDLISLCLCCSKLPTVETNEVLRSPSTDPIKLRLSKNLDGVVGVEPWPFDETRLELRVPCRRVPGRRFESVEEFRNRHLDAEVEMLNVQLKA